MDKLIRFTKKNPHVFNAIYITAALSALIKPNRLTGTIFGSISGMIIVNSKSISTRVIVLIVFAIWALRNSPKNTK